MQMMKNETFGLEELEISELIRELRLEKKIQQEVLYSGLCRRKVYFQLENGDCIMDELLSERLFSRLHVQYRWLDIMLSDENFWQKEQRHEIELQIQKKCWTDAERLLKEYEEKAPKEKIHKQYILEKRAEILFRTGKENIGGVFREALELTMSVEELETRLKGSKVLAENEMWMYLRYRNCERPFSLEEYQEFLGNLEEMFLAAQIYSEVYYETAYQYALELWRIKAYEACRAICQNTIVWLREGMKNFYLAELYCLDAIAGMRLEHNEEEEKKLFQQCKMAYYVSASFGKNETAEGILKYCGEEFKWHIIG